jgi:hypothetical protein
MFTSVYIYEFEIEGIIAFILDDSNAKHLCPSKYI